MGNSSSMRNENILVGYFFQCLTCKASFIRIVPQNCAVGHKGEIFQNDTKESTAENAGNAEKKLKLKNSASSPEGIPRTMGSAVKQFVGFVRCPDCLSRSVRLMEIGDGKYK